MGCLQYQRLHKPFSLVWGINVHAYIGDAEFESDHYVLILNRLVVILVDWLVIHLPLLAGKYRSRG
jgi:hypothetical protein